MHLGIKNFVGGARKYLFGDGSYSGNIVQGGSVLQPQASYTFVDPTDLRSTAAYSYTGSWNATYTAAMGNDGNTSTVASTELVGGQTAMWQFPSPENIAQIGIWTASPTSHGGTAVALEYSDDGSAWSSTNQTSMSWTSPTTVQNKIVNDYGAHRWWRLRNTGTNYMQFAEIAWYRRITLQNCIVVTGAATVAPDGTTGAAVVVCDTLTLDGASASLTPSTNCKGLIVFAKTKIQLLNGAKLNIDKLGKAGNFGNLTVFDLVPQSLKRKLRSSLAAYVVQGEGAAGGAKSQTSSGYTYYSGNNGLPAGAMQSGGGGGGHAYAGNMAATIGGAGGKGGPCCGGAGGGAAEGTGMGGDASPYGGPGGAGSAYDHNACGGAGNPPGSNDTGSYTITFQSGAGGGLLMLFTPALSIASGCIISADGSPGSNVSGTCMAGSGAGGGITCIFTLAGGYANNGTVRANGGAGGVGYNYGIVPGAGGAGSAGPGNIFTIS